MSKKWGHIKELAEFIALEYEEKITPLQKIIDDEGLNVFYDYYDRNTFDGMTIFDKDRFFIHINLDMGNSKDSERGRFTLAHELGHYFIDKHRQGLRNGLLKPHPSKTNQAQFYKIERQADYFAGCLLMPELKFKKDISGKKFSHKLLDFLREEYKVSRTACAFRFADIGNHPIMIVFAENNFIKWKYCSDEFPYKHLLNGNDVPENTVMGDYFKGNESDTFKTEKIWAIDCFNYVKDYDVQKQFYEYCITHKNFALSIFWED